MFLIESGELVKGVGLFLAKAIQHVRGIPVEGDSLLLITKPRTGETSLKKKKKTLSKINLTLKEQY